MSTRRENNPVNAVARRTGRCAVYNVAALMFFGAIGVALPKHRTGSLVRVDQKFRR
jgi:hypothetical protein